MRSKLLAACVAAASVVACGGGGGSGGGGTVAATGTNATADDLLTTAYYHQQDSDGGKAGGTSQVMLAFEPSGVAQVVAASETDYLAYRGTYAVEGGGTRFSFADPDFKHDFTVRLDPGAASVTLPFKVFSDGAGSSTWERRRVSAIHGVNLVFRSAVLYEHLAPDAAVARVKAYAGAVAARDARRVAAPGRSEALASAPPRALFDGLFEDAKLVAVESGAAGEVKLQFDPGGWVTVPLYGWAQSTAAPLTTGALANDPRVHLDVKASGDASSDPATKRAVFVAPFKTLRSYAWWDAPWAQRICSSCTPKTNGFHFRGSDYFDFDGVASKLQGVGYAVQQVADDAASPLAITQALFSPAAGTAGFVVMNTHGSSDGTLATGTLVGYTDEAGKDVGTGEGAKAVAALKAAGYGDLLTYDGGTEAAPKTISLMFISRDMRPGAVSAFISLTPKYWEWLRTKGASFDRSLVYMGSCLTDATPDLRNAVRARAYFAFNQPAKPEVAGAIFNYLGASLVRPSRSAEEAYYNMIRVANTRQMIFKEDKLFDGFVDGDTTEQHRILMSVFKGYGLDGANVVGYQDRGWLKTPGVDPGQVWWLVFAGRWGAASSQTAVTGAGTLVDCWNQFWSKGTTGGLASPFCQNANAGRAPTAAELSYAHHLLTGKPAPGVAAPPVQPRFTLRDGGP